MLRVSFQPKHRLSSPSARNSRQMAQQIRNRQQSGRNAAFRLAGMELFRCAIKPEGGLCGKSMVRIVQSAGSKPGAKLGIDYQDPLAGMAHNLSGHRIRCQRTVMDRDLPHCFGSAARSNAIRLQAIAAV